MQVRPQKTIPTNHISKHDRLKEKRLFTDAKLTERTCLISVRRPKKNQRTYIKNPEKPKAHPAKPVKAISPLIPMEERQKMPEIVYNSVNSYNELSYKQMNDS